MRLSFHDSRGFTRQVRHFSGAERGWPRTRLKVADESNLHTLALERCESCSGGLENVCAQNQHSTPTPVEHASLEPSPICPMRYPTSWGLAFQVVTRGHGWTRGDQG